ncbi:hypothetical protein LCGC14_2071990 [marine sediment metagenome]|uniref:Uncharacterized protein n=1 Tax=marine sediment metagenome TaxID=412755 RepID=A0A0F9F5G4_9ZZZZ
MNTALERYEHVQGYERATLPVRYEEARKHLAECERLDECKAWKDKAEALRSYARQAHDDQLYRMALKIQNRARVRMGELIRQVEKGRTGPKVKGGQPSLTRGSTARDAGLSVDEAKEAKAMSRVPETVREEMIERGATATEIAGEGRNYDDVGRSRGRRGKCSRCKGLFPLDVEHDCTPPGYKLATKLLGDLPRLEVFLHGADPKELSRALSPSEVLTATRAATSIAAWLHSFLRETKKPNGLTRAETTPLMTTIWSMNGFRMWRIVAPAGATIPTQPV